MSDEQSASTKKTYLRNKGLSLYIKWKKKKIMNPRKTGFKLDKLDINWILISNTDP